ncbi:hypothetical protein EZM97_15290 [Dyella soli]|uniref:Uncharacterized protein n=1 Tax=Dyella soli TaxID=522319 RepID=A0A4V2NLS4_9GAMM|nr:hypothetical protein [Dyella soli]TCI10261.1 hypothetical protein EZM97_15290 [Dyella soli]
MAKSHAELNEMLDALDQFIPGLVQSKPNPRDFWATFTKLADAVQENAAPEDHGWICERLDAIQVRHHLVPPADQI